MASQLLRSLGGKSPVCAPRFGGPSFCADAGKRLQVVRGDRIETSRRIITSIEHRPGVKKCGINYRGCRLRRVPGVLLDDFAICSTCVGCKRKELHACRCLRSADVNGWGDFNSSEGSSSSHIGEQREAGGETTSMCLYLKRTICDGETVEHSGSVIILGDVKQGGYVSAGGDVIVLGKLQGIVQAGRAGNHSAKVFTAFQDAGTIKIGDEASLQLATCGSSVPHIAKLSPDGSILFRVAVEESPHEQNFDSKTLSSSPELNNETVDTMKSGSKDLATQTEAIRNRRPAQVALFTGIYIFIAGLLLFGFPKLYGIMFDLQGASLGWIQVGAVLAVVFGMYYIGTAVGDMRGIRGGEAFYYSTIVGRTFLFLSFTWLVVVGAVPFPLLLVGIVNLAGAVLMWRALLKKDN